MNKIIDAETWNSLSLQEREQCIKYWKFIGINVNFNRRLLLDDEVFIVTECTVFRYYTFINDDRLNNIKPHSLEELRLLSVLM